MSQATTTQATTTQATTTQLAVPLLEHIGRDLVVVPTDGSRATRLPYYFPDVGSARIREMLASINRNIALTIGKNGRVVANGTAGPDVMLGGASQRYFRAGGGNDVVIATGATARIFGGAGDDYLIGSSGDDMIRGDDGSDLIHGVAGNNILMGGAGNDQVIGGVGDDHLHGDAGNDFLMGLQGDDSYYVSKGGGHDQLLNRDDSGTDILYLRGVGAEQLWFRRVGDDLEVRMMETGDTVTLDAWYDRPEERVDKFVVFSTAADPVRKVLSRDSVETLVQAMAAFAPPPLGSTELPAAYQAALAPVIAANWQQY